MRGHSHWRSGLTMVVAVGGLLLMHGVGARCHGPVSDPLGHGVALASMGAEVAHDGVMHVVSRGRDVVNVRSERRGIRPQVGLSHVMALCIWVLVTVGAAARRRLGAWPRASSPAASLAAHRCASRTPMVYRPRGPGRLALCVLRT